MPTLAEYVDLLSTQDGRQKFASLIQQDKLANLQTRIAAQVEAMSPDEVQHKLAELRVKQEEQEQQKIARDIASDYVAAGRFFAHGFVDELSKLGYVLPAAAE